MCNVSRRAMALALAPFNVRVNAIGPGSINTDVFAAVATNKEQMNKIMSRTPMGRSGDPTEVGQVRPYTLWMFTTCALGFHDGRPREA